MGSRRATPGLDLGSGRLYQPCSHYKVKRMSSMLTIGQLARQTGTKAETIRYYQKIGLLQPPMRSVDNYRCYGDQDHRRLPFVRRARELGFPIEQIRELIAFGEQRDHKCSARSRFCTGRPIVPIGILHNIHYAQLS